MAAKQRLEELERQNSSSNAANNNQPPGCNKRMKLGSSAMTVGSDLSSSAEFSK